MKHALKRVWRRFNGALSTGSPPMIVHWCVGIVVWTLIALSAPTLANPPTAESPATSEVPLQEAQQEPVVPVHDIGWLEKLDQALEFEISAFGALLFVLLGLLLYALFRWVHHLVRIVPIARSRRERIQRMLPFAETLVAMLYILTAVPMVFEDHPQYSPLVLTALIGGFVWVSWFAIRDFVSGVFIKIGGICRAGDWVRFEGLEGRVVEMGYRVIELETREGERCFVPYSQISRQPIGCVPTINGLAAHAFTVDVQDVMQLPQIQQCVRKVALNHHWASLIREPRIVLDEHNRLEVTVYALTPENGPSIEAKVREALCPPTESADSPPD